MPHSHGASPRAHLISQPPAAPCGRRRKWSGLKAEACGPPLETLLLPLHRLPKHRLLVASPDRPALQPTPSTPPEGQRGEPVLQTHTVWHPSHLRACAHSVAFVSDVLFPFLTWPPPMPGHGLVKSFSTPASQPVRRPHTVLAQAAYLPSTPTFTPREPGHPEPSQSQAPAEAALCCRESPGSGPAGFGRMAEPL